jgi:hypothetical protein
MQSIDILIVIVLIQSPAPTFMQARLGVIQNDAGCSKGKWRQARTTLRRSFVYRTD